MAQQPSYPNPYRRYSLTEAAFLVDGEEKRYVRISPEGGGFVVDRGTLGEGRAMFAVGTVESFGPGELADAVQRVCALSADWLGFDEWEVEQARGLFLAPPGGA